MYSTRGSLAREVVNRQCPLTKHPGGLQALYTTDDDDSIKNGSASLAYARKIFIRPGHGIPSARNFVLVVLLVVVSTKASPVHHRSSPNLGDDIIHNGIVTDFQVKS